MNTNKGILTKKAPQKWTNIYEDLKVSKVNITTDNENQTVYKEVLLCKYCGIEFDYEESHCLLVLKNTSIKVKDNN